MDTKAAYIVSEIRTLNLFCTEAEVRRQIVRLFPHLYPYADVRALIFDALQLYAAQEFLAARAKRRQQ